MYFIKCSLVKFTSGIFSSEFMVNTATLIGGTGIAQLLPLLFAPLIARLFSADDFSVYGVFVSSYSIIAVLLTLRYDLAVMLPKEEEKAKNVVALCLGSAFFLALLFVIIAFSVKEPLARLFQMEHVSHWFILVPVAAFFLAVNTVLITWYNRNKQYKVIAANKIGRNSILTGSNIGFGFAGSGYAGLLFSQIISDALAAIYYLNTFYRKALGKKIRFRREDLLVTAKEYNKFPRFTLPATFIDTFSAQLPVLLIASLYSSAMSGSFYFAYRILVLPAALIGAAYAQTFYQKFVSLITSHDYKHALSFMKKSWMLLGAIIIIPSAGIIFFGEPLFSLIFGEEWRESGKIASILIIYIMFAFVSSPTSSTYIALGMQKYTLVFSLVVVAYRFGSLYAGWMLHDFYFGLMLLVCFEVVEIVVFNSIAVIKLTRLKISSEKGH